MRSGTNFILCLLVQVLLQGCIPALGTNSTRDSSADQLSAEEFTSRINKLRQDSISRYSGNPVKIGRIHRELAHLHLSPNNPKRDLSQAASELKKYLETEKNVRARNDTENMLELLKEIGALDQKVTELQKKLHGTDAAQKFIKEKNSQIKQLSRENKALKKRQGELLADNKKLETTIEKLKFLDLNLEKKRKTFR